MEEIYKYYVTENGFSYALKREANIILRNMDKNSSIFLNKKQEFDNILTICKAIDNISPESDEELKYIFNTLNKLYNVGLLSPLTLQDDEFSEIVNVDGLKENLRYHFIKKTKDNDIINTNAYKAIIRKVYNHNSCKEINRGSSEFSYNPCIYINKGGVITGDYISSCKIRKNIIDTKCFTIQSIINIPCSMIYDEGKGIITVDHREPKLKVLEDFYDVFFRFNEQIKNKKYNIRKYKKLTNNE